MKEIDKSKSRGHIRLVIGLVVQLVAKGLLVEGSTRRQETADGDGIAKEGL